MPIEPDFVNLKTSFSHGIMPGRPTATQKINDGVPANAKTSLLSVHHDDYGVLYVCVEGTVFLFAGARTTAPGSTAPEYIASMGVPLLIAKKPGTTWWVQGASTSANRVRGGTASFFKES